MSYPCTSCGACCGLLPRQFEGWPLREDGACALLSSDNRCTIYTERPEVCHVGWMAHGEMSEEGIYEKTAEACALLQEMLDIPESFRVKLDSTAKA